MAAAMLLCVLGLLASMGSSAAAAPIQWERDTFSGSVELLKQEGGTCVMQVTVENRGEDFTGTVQLVFSGKSYRNCAYNTPIVLPGQGKKQFTVTISDRAVDMVRGVCALNFLDEKGNLLQSTGQSNVFGNAKAGIQVGILSDSYSELTYLDGGGRNLWIQGFGSPVSLVELNQDNLKESLSGLYFLVIDQFNVSSLGEETIQSIQDWVKDGGWLMLGTGEYADQTLSGFEEDFLKMDVGKISQSGEENNILVTAVRHGDYYEYLDNGIDFSQMAIAELNFDRTDGDYYESQDVPAVQVSRGDGIVSVYYFSLGEKELQKMPEYMVLRLYETNMYASTQYQYYSNDSELGRLGRRALAFIGNSNTEVNFGFLDVLIGAYVVLIGPVLYLILRRCGKREWYWVCVPALGLVFIVGVYFMGQGTRVNGTRLFSVTVQQAESTQADTYLLGFHSGMSPWTVELAEGYTVAGPGLENYYGSGAGSVDNYFYLVENNDSGLSVGIKPQENFENGYLYAGKKTQSRGNITGQGVQIEDSIKDPEGILVNGTDYDMAYMAIWDNSRLYVFSDVKAGETLNLQQDSQSGKCVYQNSFPYYSDLLYDMVDIYGYNVHKTYEQDTIAALLIGLLSAQEAMPADQKSAIAVGVVKDYEKAAEEGSETSYGCLYSYIETEGQGNASN